MSFLPQITSSTTSLLSINKHLEKPIAALHEQVPVSILHENQKIPTQQGIPFIDQIRRDNKRVPVPVRVNLETLDDGTKEVQVLLGDPHSPILYFPPNLPEHLNTTELKGDIRLGGFVFVEDQNSGKVLFIQKKSGFWFIPGGLVDPEDSHVWHTATREVREETGVQLSGEGTLMYFYNSIIPPQRPERQNLMAIYQHSGDYIRSPMQIDDEEIAQAMWYSPHEFWIKHLKNSKFSLPSIQLAFRHYIQDKQAKICPHSQFWLKYNELKQKHCDVDPILFDLCFFTVQDLKKQPHLDALMEALIIRVRDQAKSLLLAE